MRKLTRFMATLFAAVIAFSAVTFMCEKPVHAALLSTNNSAAVAYYYALPDSVRSKLEARGVTFEVNDYAVLQYSGTSRAMGVTRTSVSSRTHAIVAQHVYVRNGNEDSILHEAGHCISDYNGIYGYWTNNIGWQTIYREEVGNAVAAGMGNANLYSASEYFAECFQLYVTNPQSLLAYCPQSYAYVQAVLMTP